MPKGQHEWTESYAACSRPQCPWPAGWSWCTGSLSARFPSSPHPAQNRSGITVCVHGTHDCGKTSHIIIHLHKEVHQRQFQGRSLSTGFLLSPALHRTGQASQCVYMEHTTVAKLHTSAQRGSPKAIPGSISINMFSFVPGPAQNRSGITMCVHGTHVPAPCTEQVRHHSVCTWNTRLQQNFTHNYPSAQRGSPKAIPGSISINRFSFVPGPAQEQVRHCNVCTWNILLWWNLSRNYNSKQYFHLSPYNCCFVALKMGLTPKIHMFWIILWN